MTHHSNLIKKLFMLKKLFLFCLIGFIYQSAFPQVGINTENPNSLTSLDVSLSSENGEIIPKGIMIPRMTEVQRNSIDVTDLDNANSLLIYNTTEDCYNYFSKTKNLWISICGGSDSEDAVFTVDCTQASIKGNYMVNSMLTESNYIVLTVVVSAAGSYNISAFPSTDNGYYFSSIGEFIKAGSYTIKIPGYGTPTTANEAGDELIIQNNDLEICNNLLVKVNSARYTVDCSSVVISGDYVATVPLTSKNTIEVKVTADASLEGYAYETSTPVQNGYSFSASGTLISGEQTITLKGSGTPIKNGTDTFVLKNNSTVEGIQYCEAKVNVAARPVRILTITSTSVSYNIGNSSNYGNMALNNPNYFSLNSSALYNVSGFVFSSLTSNGKVETTIASFNPDIIFTQYPFVPTTNEISILTDFVNNGGIFIYCTDNGNSVTVPMIKSIFDNNTTITATSNENNDVATIENSGTVITNGPFKDLSGLGMARDAGSNFGLVISSLPANEYTVIASSSSESARMIAHKTKGFVFIGDGGPFGTTGANTSAYNNPAKFQTVDGNTVAIENTNSTPASYNSYLFLNTIAWAIDYIKKSGQYP